MEGIEGSRDGAIFRTMLKVVLVGIAGIGFFWSAGTLLPGGANSEVESAPASRSNQEQPESAQAQPQRWSGSGEQDLTTDIFRMDGSWMLEGTASPEFPNDRAASIFSAIIKRPDGSYVDMVELGLGTNRSFVHESGRFYVEVTAANIDSWALVARPGGG